MLDLPSGAVSIPNPKGLATRLRGPLLKLPLRWDPIWEVHLPVLAIGSAAGEEEGGALRGGKPRAEVLWACAATDQLTVMDEWGRVPLITWGAAFGAGLGGEGPQWVLVTNNTQEARDILSEDVLLNPARNYVVGEDMYAEASACGC